MTYNRLLVIGSNIILYSKTYARKHSRDHTFVHLYLNISCRRNHRNYIYIYLAVDAFISVIINKYKLCSLYGTLIYYIKQSIILICGMHISHRNIVYKYII